MSNKLMSETVVVLNQFALPRDQGGGTRHTDLFRHLKAYRHKIIAGNRNHYTQKQFTTDDPTFQLVAVPPAGSSAISRVGPWIIYAAKAAAKTIASRKIVAIYASTPQLLAPVAGLVASRFMRVPFILEVRDIWPESIASAGAISESSLVYRALKRLEIHLVRSADAIVGVVEGWEDYFAQMGLERSHYWFVPNGTDPADFKISASRNDLRKKYGITGYTAIFAGAHGPKDGIDKVIDAAQSLPRINFLLVGAGTEKAAARERAQARGLENVRFLDTVAKSELPNLLAACDVGIHAVAPLPIFDRGMSPNKLFDYMAAGLPIVSNAAGPLDKVVKDDEIGAIGGPDELADCLVRVSQANNAKLDDWSRKAETYMETRFSRRAAADRLEMAIEQARNTFAIRQKRRLRRENRALQRFQNRR